MGWKIIEIENGEKINLFLNNIVINSGDNKIIIPISDIDVLLINNYMLKITVQLINALCENNVLTIICDNQYLPSSNILPIIGNYNTIKVLDSQLNWTVLYKSNLWKQIITQKITNQAILLKKFLQMDKAYESLISLSHNIKDFDISNREGHASKIYWHSLFGVNFKRHENDYYNKLLNYGYTILRSYLARSIIKKGLDPRISIFHRSYHNYFALSSDLMEPFRVLIDLEVIKIFQTGEVDFYQHKQLLITCFNKKIFVNNDLHFVNNAIDIFIDSIINHADIPKIKLNYESD